MTKRSGRSRDKRGARRGDGATLLLGRTAVCSLAGISQRQLLLWEHENLISPASYQGADRPSEPLYAPEVLKRVRLIRTLAEDLEVNLPGIDVILNLLEQLER